MIEREQYLFVEKYRPNTIKDCVLPEKTKTIFQGIVDKKEMPNLLLCGTAGVGKTTVAKALCNELGCDFIQINGSDENGIDVLRTKIKQFASSVSFTGGRKVVILDEADYLSAAAQAGFRGLIEEFAINCSFIFTCNFKTKIIEPIHSRCSVIDFRLPKEEKPGLAGAFIKRLMHILTQENIPFEKPVLIEVVKKFFPDYRRTLNEIQVYAHAAGKIDVGILNGSNSINAEKLIQALKEKKYSIVREWVVENLDNEPARIYRKIYDALSEALEPQSIPQVVVILGMYQYQAAFVADHELNLLACLTEILSSNLGFK